MPKQPTLTISASRDLDGVARLTFYRDGSCHGRRYLEAEYGQALRDVEAFFGLTPTPMEVET